MKSNHTKGKVYIDHDDVIHSECLLAIGIEVGYSGKSKNKVICEFPDWRGDSYERIDPKERNGNKALILNSFKTTNKCKLLPSELLAQRNELLAALKSVSNTIGVLGHRDSIVGAEVLKIVSKAIKSCSITETNNTANEK